ncbi:glycosyl hydrolase family 18 protein [Paenibacillus sp. NAIST15-1]|uniref:fibronectin type III domain-containing protein n=1 Tax=Paenibacillus sp. NAIST15-1 TaxID=1605994 RepID=UPI00086A385F|nr:glycosyl hydrolase family 18 protein [Paenibacillus sp. NAIST15-1]GAV13082.1 exochitinase 1 [Paenibacillus sp. NAIST15-1]
MLRTGNTSRRKWMVVLHAALALMLLQGLVLWAPQAQAAVSSKTIVGYWHNFDNGSGFIKLRDVSPKFDVINVSFAEPTSGVTNGTIGFTPYNYTDTDFKSDVAYLQSQGKKVIISIGGQNGQVQLPNAGARDNFVNSVIAIIEKYGFNGLDVDFEGHSLYLNAGDSDFKNPTTPVIVNLIAALRTINNHFGTDNFYLTMAPETFFVQLGYTFYGGSCISCDNRAGAYLPVIHATRDILDWLQVQNYNSGPITGLDDQYHTMGNADFHVAMADMLLTGFPVAKNPNNFFPALRQDQVMLGLPANTNAGGGFTTVAEVHKALDALMKGVQLSSYKTRGSSTGYPNFRGLMTWSVNWDKFNNFEFSNSHRAYLDALTPPIPDTEPPSVPTNVIVTAKTSTSVSLSWTASTDNVGVTGYTVSYGTQSVSVSNPNAVISGLTPDTNYTFTISAKDAKGNQSAASAPLTVKTAPTGSGGDTTPPTSPGNLQVTGKSATSVTLSWSASTDNVGVTGYTVSYGTNAVNVTATSASITGLTPNTNYVFTVTAKDAAGNVSTGTSVQVTTDVQGGAQPWAPNVSYKANDEVTYGGKTYVCRQAHTSLLGWEPSNVPALWQLKS